jgi:Sulfotransferase domain
LYDETWSSRLQGITSLSAFPKSGVTYLSFLLFHSIFPEEHNIHDLERKYILDIHAYPNATFGEPQAPRLIKSHFPCNPNIPSVRLTSKVIYLMRHPIDVMMSAWDYQHLINGGGTPDTQSPAFRAYVCSWLSSGGLGFPQFGSWTQHVRSWLGQSNIPLHLVTYENLVDNPERELQSIFDFIGIHIPAERQRTAIERSSMKAMAAFESRELEQRVNGIFFRSNLAAGYERGYRFINKGYRNSYEFVLKADERALADRVFGKEIASYFGAQP